MPLSVQSSLLQGLARTGEAGQVGEEHAVTSLAALDDRRKIDTGHCRLLSEKFRAALAFDALQRYRYGYP